MWNSSFCIILDFFEARSVEGSDTRGDCRWHFAQSEKIGTWCKWAVFVFQFGVSIRMQKYASSVYQRRVGLEILFSTCIFPPVTHPPSKIDQAFDQYRTLPTRNICNLQQKRKTWNPTMPFKTYPINYYPFRGSWVLLKLLPTRLKFSTQQSAFLFARNTPGFHTNSTWNMDVLGLNFQLKFLLTVWDVL